MAMYLPRMIVNARRCRASNRQWQRHVFSGAILPFTVAFLASSSSAILGQQPNGNRLGLLDACLRDGRVLDQASSPLGSLDGQALEAFDRVRAATGVSLSDVEIIACPGVGNAYAVILENPERRRVIVFDPVWLQGLTGENALHVSVIIAHELGHIVNGHGSGHLGAFQRGDELEADQFAGCALARIAEFNDGWEALYSVIQRIRQDRNTAYASRFVSLEKTRASYEACWYGNARSIDPPGRPLSPADAEAIETLLGWIESAALLDDNQKAAYVALLTSALFDNRVPAEAILSEIIWEYQFAQDLGPSGELDDGTRRHLAAARELGDYPLLRDIWKAQHVRMTECLVADDFRILARVGRLRELDLRGAWFCEAGDEYFELANLKQLEVLSLRSASGLTEDILASISRLESLESLSLRDIGLSNVKFLEGLVELRSLDLEGNPIHDISPLRNSRKLESLSLHNTKVEDISVLANLLRLKELEISFTSVRDISPLLDLEYLRWVEAWNAPLTNVGQLSGLRSLDILDARGGGTTANDIRAFESHGDLEFLVLDEKWSGSQAVKLLQGAQQDLAISFR